MHHYFEAITNTSGDSLVGYYARVIDPATQNTVTMSADDNGTPIVTKSGVDNMGSTDDYGNLDFYVTPGTYHLDIYAPNATSFIFRVPNVAMNSSKGDTGPAGTPGTDGASGPANSTYATLVAFKAADVANVSANYNGSLWFFKSGDFTGRANDVTIVKAGSTPITSGAWVRQYEALDPIWFGATGNNAAVDTPAIQAALNMGGVVNLGPADALPLVINTTIVVSQPGTILTGRRRIETTSAVTRMEAIKITGNDSVVDGVRLSNPSLINEQAGYQTWGIAISAQRCKVTNCSVLDFQMCYGVLPTGEYYDNKFVANYGRVLGGGNGPVNTVSDEGENRGDGIADFGARTTIIGNTLQAANALYGNNGNGPRIAGTDYNDCRIGIDVEGLPGYGDNTGPDDSAATIVANNHVIPSEDGKGRFRRCYSIEGIQRCNLTGNYGRGWTWAGIWFTGTCNDSIVSNNILQCTIPASDQTGAIWGPRRAGILIYADGGLTLQNITCSGNLITCNTDLGAGIFATGPSGMVRNVTIRGNKIVAGATMGSNSAILLTDVGNGISVADNDIVGLWANGLYGLNVASLDVTGNTVQGVSLAAVNLTTVATATIVGVRATFCANGFVYSNVASCTMRNCITSSITTTPVTFVSGTLHFINNHHIDGNGVMFDFGTGNVATIKGNTGYSTYTGARAITPGPTSDTAGELYDINLQGARPGDSVRVSYSVYTPGFFLIGTVNTGNQVTVRTQNWSGAAATLAAGTITARIERN